MEAYWIVSRQDHPLLKTYIPDVLEGTAGYLKNYLNII
jgi:hypothetical protein